MSSVRKRLHNSLDPQPSGKKPRLDQPGLHSLTLVEEVPGRIASIEMENFMCHRKLRVDFDVVNNNCFFIGGANGSGKSALFAALNIGLGGQGNMNGRGNSLQHYIKHGARRAKITVTLTNTGQGRHNEYDDFIVVERTISPTGSTYLLKSVNGNKETVVSRVKRDLDRLLVRFGIQLRNPIFWMSQDRCRTFLQEMRPSKLYSAFALATGLDLAIASYNELKKMLKEIGHIKAAFKDHVTNTQKEYLSMKARYDVVLSIEKYKKDMSELQWVMFWFPYKDAVKEVEKLNRESERTTEEVERNIQKQLQIQDKLESVKVENIALRNECSKLEEELGRCEREEEEKSKAYAERKEELRNEVQILSSKKKELKSIETEIVAVERYIKDIERKEVDEQEVAKSQHPRILLAELDSKLNKLRSESSQLDKDKAKRKAELTAAESELSKWRVEIKGCEDALKMACEKQDRARALQQDRMSRFGRRMQRIVALVEASTTLFIRKPIGPIGNYVRVLDERYELAIEIALSPLLEVFVCDNIQDSRTFEELLLKHGIAPSERIISKFTEKRYKTQIYEPVAELATVMRYIEVSDTNVFNALVDHLRIESIMLIEDDDCARHLMSSNPPRNIHKAFTMSGAEVIPKSSKRVYTFYTNNRRNNGVRILSHSQSLDSTAIEAEVAAAKEALGQSRTSFEAARDAFEKASGELTLSAERFEKLQKKITNTELEKRHRERELEAIEKKTADEYRSRAEEAKAEVEKKMRQVEEYEAKCRMAEEELRAVEPKCNELRMKMEQWKDELEKSTELLERLESKLAHYSQNGLRLGTRMRELQAEINGAMAKVEKAREEARACDDFQRPSIIQDPPNVDDLPDALKTRQEYAAIKRRVEAIEKRSQGVTIDGLKAMEERCRQMRSTFRMIQSIYQNLNTSVARRRQEFNMRRGLMGLCLSELYEKLLACKHFRGHLDINHSEHTIKIVTEPAGRLGDCSMDNSDTSFADQREYGSLQDPRGLSGGERTYTVACFIMALWEAVEAPFRCMDEFDVFLDLNNRKAIMELLVNMATLRYPHKQFLFFTPQGLQDLGAYRRVQIFEMPTSGDP